MHYYTCGITVKYILLYTIYLLHNTIKTLSVILYYSILKRLNIVFSVLDVIIFFFFFHSVLGLYGRITLCSNLVIYYTKLL